MAQWEDDLRVVVEHRGAALVEHARGLVAAPEPDGPDPAVALTAAALEAAFRRGGRRPTGEHGSVRLVSDDELDALAALVRREQERLARSRGDAAGPAPSASRPDDGPSEALTAHLATMVTHVREARRRGRRRGLVGSAAVVVVAALATTAFAARPWDRPTPDPAPTTTPYAGACGSRLPSGRSLAPVTYDSSASVTGNTVVPDGWWAPAYVGGLTDPTSDELDVLDHLKPEVVLVRDGTIVALGVDATASSGDGTIVALGVDATASSGDGGTGDARPTFADLAPDSPLYVPVRFAACDGGDVEPGTYQAYAFATTDDQRTHVLSDATTLTVLDPSAEADGYQPTWLAGSPLACGEKADDFVARAAAYPVDQLDQTGSALYDDGEAVLLRNNGRTARKVKVPRGAVAWVQDGRIVGVGPDERATTATTIGRGKQVEVSVRRWDTTNYCAPTSGGEPGHLPAGTYQAIFYGRIPADDPSQPDEWVVEDDRGNDLLVHDDGTVGYDDSTSTEALALAKTGYQPSWVRGGPLVCRMTDEEFTEAATADAVVGIDGTFSVDEEGSTGVLLAERDGKTVTVTTPRRAGLAWFTDFRGAGPTGSSLSALTPGRGAGRSSTGTPSSRRCSTRPTRAHQRPTGLPRGSCPPGTTCWPTTPGSRSPAANASGSSTTACRASPSAMTARS
ncbi:hypothetical protein GCM10025864_07670 [Luteimicrobium album]|uniref:Uncharacterized protein n=1 Tax=Luteimicrobium album TaxID=1054550 RepID=A0ABQ6HWW2_9MICO|nr:hypothetical protein [Luteimicrobium album]GMA23008.1 hypothetical protein GCM10025864_07670 [Luteimicrobium album]